MKCILQPQPLLILFAEIQRGAVCHGISFGRSRSLIITSQLRPLNADFRVVPGKTTLVAGVVKICDLIAEFGGIAQHQKAVGKALRNIIEDKAKFEELKSRYFGMEMTDGEIEIHSIDSVDDYYEIGERNHRSCLN